ncbi:MAG TPA: hypothetical protein VMN36_01335 [Verrucomicrobiales bacterium]|nr:hypothetical protein [Verrucomicrobiales bacterium]
MKVSLLRLTGVLVLLATPAPAAVTIVDAVRFVTATVNEVVLETRAEGADATGLFDEEEVVNVGLNGSTAIATAGQLSFIAADALLFEASNETAINNETSVIGTDAFAPVEAVSDFLVEFEITGIAHTAHLVASVFASDEFGGFSESFVSLEIPLGAVLHAIDTSDGAQSLDESLVLDPGLYRLRASSRSEDFDAESYFAGGNFAFRLELAPIPEPSAPLLMALPVLAFLMRRRRSS